MGIFSLPCTPPSQQAPQPSTPPPHGTSLLTAWTHSAQLATAFLIGLATALLAVHGYGYSRGGSKPSVLARDSTPLYRIDLNQADRAELLQLPGVGDALADRLEDYRRRHGPFRSVDELREIHGIGPATLEKLRPWVYVSAPDQEKDDNLPALLVRRDLAGAAPGIANMRPRTVGKKEASLKEPIDVNRASLEELQRLPGIGQKMSQRIVDERQKAPFKSVDELKRVSGIGPKTLEKLRPFVTVKEPSLRPTL